MGEAIRLVEWATIRREVDALSGMLRKAAEDARILEMQAEALGQEVDETRMTLAVVQGALSALVEALQEDAVTRRLGSEAKLALETAARMVEPEAWERVVERFEELQKALMEIAGGAVDPQGVAERALELE